MDCEKTGKLIRRLRQEKGYTQAGLADRLHVSDKAVSKWERGLGCPDISLLPQLSALLGAELESLIIGDMAPKDANGGNMKKLKFLRLPGLRQHNYSGSGGFHQLLRQEAFAYRGRKGGGG